MLPRGTYWRVLLSEKSLSVTVFFTQMRLVPDTQKVLISPRFGRCRRLP